MGFIGDTLKEIVTLGPLRRGLSQASKLADESESAINKRKQLEAQGQAASNFANQGETGYGQLGWEAAIARDRVRRLAEGQDSMSAEQLRQGLQQQRAAQMSMAAGASPNNAAMAARTAANNMGRLGYGMAGQAALAGIAERQAAQKQLADMILAQRQQDAQVALGSRQNAIGGYGGVTPEGSFIEKWGPAISAATGSFGARGK